MGGRVLDLSEKGITNVYGSISAQRYSRYEGVGRCQISRKKSHVTLECPLMRVAEIKLKHLD